MTSSKSRQIGIWIDEALELAPVEYWRYSLLRNRPEKQDSNFLWSQFEKDVLELNDIIGNFIHRTLSFISKRYDGIVPTGPEDSEMDEDDKNLIATIHSSATKVSDLLENFHLKEALNEIVSIARVGNVYINNKAPWKQIKNDKVKAGHTFYLSIQLVRTLGILLSPYIPNISEQIFNLIGEKITISEVSWDSASELKVESGRKIPVAKPLFQKLDIAEIKKNLNSLHGINEDSEALENSKAQKSKNKKQGSKKSKNPKKEIIEYSDFQKLDLRTGTILDAEKVPDSDHLLKLLVDVGDTDPRTIVAGIGDTYSADEIVGSQIVVLVNLAPKSLRGIESQGMLLAVDMKKKGAALLRPNSPTPNGSHIR